jgi:hypothetical protein
MRSSFVWYTDIDILLHTKSLNDLGGT